MRVTRVLRSHLEISISNSGEVLLKLMVNGVSVQGKLLDVLHVPSFVYSLVSVIALAKQGLDVKFNADSVRYHEERCFYCAWDTNW